MTNRQAKGAMVLIILLGGFLISTVLTLDPRLQPRGASDHPEDFPEENVPPLQPCTAEDLLEFGEEYELCHSQAIDLISHARNQSEDQGFNKRLICQAIQITRDECSRILSWCYSPIEIEATKNKQMDLIESSLSLIVPDFDPDKECGALLLAPEETAPTTSTSAPTNGTDVDSRGNRNDVDSHEELLVPRPLSVRDSLPIVDEGSAACLGAVPRLSIIASLSLAVLSRIVRS